MTIGKAYRDIQAAKRKAEQEIHRARWEHPLVARPTARPQEPSDHHRNKTRARHDSIKTNIMDMKSTPQSVIDEVENIMKKGKKKDKKGNGHVVIHGSDKDESIVRDDNDASSYTDHSFKEMATNPAIGGGAGPSSPLNSTPSTTRNPSNKIRSGFSPDYKKAKEKAKKKNSNFQKIRKVLNKEGEN